MYPLTQETPKALLPVAGRPMLDHLRQKLLPADLETREVILVSNHKFAPAFQRWVQALESPIPWTLLDDGSTCDEDRLGSVGDLAFAIRKRAPREDLLVLGSDNLFEDGLTGFAAFARRKGAIALGACELPDRILAGRYGVLSADAEGRVTAFAEKPADPASSLVSTAVYFFPRKAVPRVLEYTSSRRSADTLGSFISWLIAREPVYAYPFRGAWFDIGDIASYKQAQESFHL